MECIRSKTFGSMIERSRWLSGRVGNEFVPYGDGEEGEEEKVHCLVVGWSRPRDYFLTIICCYLKFIPVNFENLIYQSINS